jgi:hypothetical protein
MKFKTTAKELKEGYNYIISTGYCDIQSLFSYKNPIAYSSGIYGWNFDVYDIDGIAITTGYRGMPSKRSKSDYKLIHEYEKQAEGKTKEEKDLLIRKFINDMVIIN